MARKRSSASRPFEGESELIVVADPGAGIRATPGGLEAAAVDAAPISSALGSDATARPLFGATEDRVRFGAIEEAALVGAAAADLASYYVVDVEESRRADLAEELLSLEGIVGAYVKPPAEPAVDEELINEMTPSEDFAPPVTPDFTARQIYLDAAPAGIDARFAWTLPGGRGAGVRIVDIEGAWRFDHEDMLTNQGGVVGTPSGDIGWRNHGTAVAGEYGGDVNPFGVTGICPDAVNRGFSIVGGKGSARAIREAADSLAAGDIILIELHRPGPDASGSGQDGFIAIEWWEDDFAAIRYATTRGVIVVEAAGNGARNLDAPIFNVRPAGFPPTWTNPFNRANRDSGAVVVGAGAPPPGTHGRDHGPDRSRLGFSNWGSMVDAQGWGREVTTTAYGDLQGGSDENVWYTDQFSGTSSASPIVVGALGCVQGVRRARGQALLTPATARATLRSSGSPQQDAPSRPASQRIGNRPNLRAILAPKKIEIKENKLEKIEIKEIKREKGEKLEFKEHKNEKLEIKERKEKIEVKENKREKLELEKHQALEKNFAQEIKPREVIRDIINPTEAGGAIEQRLAAIEAGLAQLEHFIGQGLRPDLSQGALTEEPDLGQYGGYGKYEPEKLSEG